MEITPYEAVVPDNKIDPDATERQRRRRRALLCDSSVTSRFLLQRVEVLGWEREESELLNAAR